MILQHALYTSQAVLPAEPVSRLAAIVAILASARRFNEQHNLSGYLTLVDGQFLQILEGDAGSIRDVLRKISLDTRNDKMLVLEQSEIEERMFFDWSMGCSLAPELINTALNFAGITTQTSFAKSSSGALKTFLVMLSNISARRNAELPS
jgi:Sensors of blue-light using FAD